MYPRVRVRWEGPFFQVQSLARVNRELVLALLRLGVDVRCVPLGEEQSDAFAEDRWQPLRERMSPGELPAADVVVRHGYPPAFGPAPDGIPVVVVAPWEFGYVPRAWVEGSRWVAEVWGPSSYVRDCYVRSGVPAEKVGVVPNGIDPSEYRVDGPAMALDTDRTFRFLYVGGAITRKGLDLLLEAWREAFTADDDVALVVKDALAGGIYRLQSQREAILRAAADPACPRIVYLDRDLSDAELASLYRACQVMAFPTRGEGYGLPLAEAQACGVPVITTGYGGAMDFCDASDGWLVPPRLETVPNDRLRHDDCSGIPFWAVAERDALVAMLREARRDVAATRARGLAAAKRMREAHTWEHAARVALERLRAVASAAAPPSLVVPPVEASSLAASLIVVARNAPQETRDCVESILAYTALHPERHELILVDNGSDPETADFLASVAVARHLRLDEPVAPSAAFNAGLRAARGRVRICMHNDVVVSKGWLERFLAAFPHDGRATVAGPRSNRAPGVQQVPVPYVNLRQMHRFAFDLARSSEAHRKHMEVGALDSFCIAMNEAAMQAVGFFDETFTHRFYAEDLCVRARAAGADVFCAGDVFVHHEGGASFRDNQVDAMQVFRRDRAPFMRRHHPRKVVAMLRLEEHAATLPRVLSFLESCVDEIVVLDNGSTDEGWRLALASPKVVELRRQDFEPDVTVGWSVLLEMAGRRVPDWVLAMEGDEVFEDRFGPDLPNLVNPEPESISGHTFPVFHMWDEGHYRAEPSWTGGRRGGLFRWRAGLAYAAVGCGDERLPTGIAGNTIFEHFLRVRHLGFLDPARREAELEATRRSAVPAACDLPLASPLLAPWREEPTAGHESYRTLVLERIPLNAERVLVVAPDPAWWGNLLRAWGRAEVVGWVTPGGDDRPSQDLDAMHVMADWSALPCSAGPFDAVVLVDVLGRVPDASALLADLRPLLSERGALVASLPNAHSASWLLARRRGDADVYVHRFTLEEARGMAEAAGCAVARLEGVQAPAEPEWKALAREIDPEGALRDEHAVSHYVLVACPDPQAIGALYERPVPTLSACLIVKNEESVLARCLQSVKEVADEIVVVDTGSTDRTVEVAQRFGARVFHHPWRDDFADARNVSLEKATCDWILVMDADEVLDQGSAPMVRRVLASGNVPGRIRMYYLHEISYLMKGDLAQEASEHENMRLFPNRPDIRFVGRIHEQVKYIGTGSAAEAARMPGAPEAEPPEGVVLERFTTPIVLHHYGYVEQEWQRKNRDERNLTLLRRAVEESPDDAFNWFNLGCHLGHTGDPEESLAAFLRSIELIGPEESTGYLPLCYILGGMAMLEVGRGEEALPLVGKALEKFPDLPDAHYAAGYIHARLGHREEAREHYRQAIQGGGKPRGYLGSTDASAATWKPHMELGILEMQDDRWERALEHFLKALHFKPDMPALWANRGRCHLRLKDLQRAEDAFIRAHAMGFRDPRMLEDMAGVHAALAHVEDAARVAGELATMTGEARHHLLLAQLLGRLQRWGEAVEALDRVPALDLDGALLRARALLHLGRLEEARGLLDAVLAQLTGRPDEPAAGHGFASLETDVPPARRPGVAAIMSLLGAVALAEGRGDEARARYREALQLDESLTEARIALADLEQRFGDVAESRRHLDALAAAHETVPAIAQVVARGYRALSDPRAALKVLRTAIPFSAEPLPMLRAAADAASACGELPTAASLLSAAHQQAPGDADVLFDLGRVLLGLEDYAAAASALDACCARDPRNGEARALLEGLRMLRGGG